MASGEKNWGENGAVLQRTTMLDSISKICLLNIMKSVPLFLVSAMTLTAAAFATPTVIDIEDHLKTGFALEGAHRFLSIVKVAIRMAYLMERRVYVALATMVLSPKARRRTICAPAMFAKTATCKRIG